MKMGGRAKQKAEHICNLMKPVSFFVKLKIL